MSLPTDFSSSNASGPERTPMGRHTYRRREPDSKPAEEPPPAEQQHTTDTQPRGPGGVNDGGFQFEMKMAALIGLRGLQRGNFELFSNKDDAGNFDDLVYTAGGRRYFLQLKHTDSVDKNKLPKKELVPLLQKCFISYCAIKHGGDFKDIAIDKTEFIIYTNRELDQEMSQHIKQQREIDAIFKTCDKGQIFNFTPDKNKKIDVYTLLENSVKRTKQFRHLRDQEMVKEFLNKLIMATGQKGRVKLDELMKKEIREGDAAIVDDDVYSAELLAFKERVETLCRDTKDRMTATMFRSWLQEAKTASCREVVKTLVGNCETKLRKTGITFSDCEISRLQAVLSKKRAVLLRSDAVTLCSKLLLDCLLESECIFVNFERLQSNKNILLHAWLGGHWEYLIVSCDATVKQSDILRTCLEMPELIKHDPSSKRVIIVTEHSVEQIKGFRAVKHEFRFQQLSKKSQETVLSKKIDFQGCEVTMRSVLQRHGNVEHVLGPELVTDLITEETAVNIGCKLHVNTGYYAPRVLERKVWLLSKVLRDSKDGIAVSGTTKEDVLKIVPSGETVDVESLVDNNMTDFTQDMNTRIFLLPDEDVEDYFLAICDKLEGKPLHWVEFNNGDLMWKMSRGGTDSLLDYVDAEKTLADKRIIAESIKSGSCEVNEESIWDLGERTVLVVAEPGMGKSSTTTHVAWRTKERDPTSWVVRINWNDHTKELDKINAATFNFDTLLEFLFSAAFPDLKYPDFNSSLLKLALQSTGNVTVLMDGFDEISPTYADIAAVILSELTKTKVGRLWVTSRPVKKESLENELSFTAYSMKKLSLTSQEDMLSILWKQKAGEEKIKKDRLSQFVGYLLPYLSNSLHDDNFTGCPLYIKMIATVYEMEVETFLISEEWIEPKIGLLNLYEKFVEKMLHIYLTEKQKADITNSSVLTGFEVVKEAYLIHFENCALAAILPPDMLESLHNKKIEEEIQPFLRNVQAGKDKTGVVMNVVEGKPQFVHRTFAEYFTARWFSKNFESNRSVLEYILFDDEYSFVGDMFDRMMTKDCPLHCAVLNRDSESFETLLQQKECDVNAVDKGDRTVIHIIAKCTHKVYGGDEDILDFIHTLIHHGVSLDTTDRILHWRPLQYAIKLEAWFILERLLERNVDRSGLDMIRQRAQDTDYIHPIIIESAQMGHILLLEFLCSIGVKINQESDLGFPFPLHFAIKGNNLQVVRWLIKHGADCNSRYSDGQTALHYAVTEGSLDVVRVLVEEGGASLDVRDDCGRTVIDWANDCMSDPNYLRYNPDNFISRLKEIVKYLRERVCKVSSSVRQSNDT